MHVIYTSERWFRHARFVAASKFQVVGHGVKRFALQRARSATVETADLVVQTGIAKASEAAVFARLHARGRVWVCCSTFVALVPFLAMRGSGLGIQHRSVPRDRNDKSEGKQSPHFIYFLVRVRAVKCQYVQFEKNKH